MSKNKHNRYNEPAMHNLSADAGVEVSDVSLEPEAPETFDVVGDSESQPEVEALKDLLQKKGEDLQKANDDLEKEKKEYLFLMAEFDNFRKRTMRERSDLIKNAGEDIIKGLLPILDDFERGLKAIAPDSNAESVKEGMELIYKKLVAYLEQRGVKEIPSTDAPFDTELHEAVAMVPTDDAEKKGKVIDTVMKGYTLNDKVIRHAKVAVGQ